MQTIFSIDDCPLLDDVDFLQCEEDCDDHDECEDKKSQESRSDYMKMSPSELGLIYIATRKDTDFTKLYNVIKKTLYKNVIKVVGKNRDDIETVIDMTMMYVYLNIDKYDVNKSNFCSWVHGIAKNTALNHINRFGHNNPNMHSTDFSELYDSSIMTEEEIEPGVSPYVNEDEGFIDIVYNRGTYKVYMLEDVLDDFFDVIDTCINQMSSQKRETFVQRLINNRTIKDTANIVGISGTSVKRYYNDGKQNVVDCIKKDHPELYEMMKDIY